MTLVITLQVKTSKVDQFAHPVSRQEEDCKYYIHFYLDDMTIPLDTHAQQGTTLHYKNFYCFFVYSLVLNKRPPAYKFLEI